MGEREDLEQVQGQRSRTPAWSQRSSQQSMIKLMCSAVRMEVTDVRACSRCPLSHNSEATRAVQFPACWDGLSRGVIFVLLSAELAVLLDCSRTRVITQSVVLSSHSLHKHSVSKCASACSRSGLIHRQAEQVQRPA